MVICPPIQVLIKSIFIYGFNVSALEKFNQVFGPILIAFAGFLGDMVLFIVDELFNDGFKLWAFGLGLAGFNFMVNFDRYFFASLGLSVLVEPLYTLFLWTK
jgi:hypothetical protein